MINYIKPYLQQELTGIAWDGPMSFDPYGAVGHYNAHHVFVRQYTGQYVDKSWATAQATALGQFLSRARAINPNVKFAVDQWLDCTMKESLWALPFRHTADTIVDEEGYTNWAKHTWITSSPGKYCANQWLEKTNTYIQFEKAGEHLVLIDATPFRVTPYMTDKDPRARAYMQWSLANYLLVKYSQTYLWFGQNQHYGYPIVPQHEELVNLGNASGQMRYSQGVYLRYFAEGMSLVNPNPKKSFAVTLPKDTYQSLYGQNLNTVLMRPHSGLVLIDRVF